MTLKILYKGRQKRMKNVFKKIAATAMALTLLGAGTAITNTISPQTSNTLTAVAACHYHGQFIYKKGGTYTETTVVSPFIVRQEYQNYYCRECGGFVCARRVSYSVSLL
ncbi:MAG TPA: hypothetical protein P5092_06205 [Ruminococcus sp.]|mgnify:CR=1 FL=1|nr:hypothetical protein [Ruminococcus sp.]